MPVRYCPLSTHCRQKALRYIERVSAWVSLLGLLVSAVITAASGIANLEAKRTGRLRFLFWHIPGWWEREKDRSFFRWALGLNENTTVFFGVLTLLCGAYFLDALGLLT